MALRFLLDTNLVSELTKAQPNAGVLRMLKQTESVCALGAPTLCAVGPVGGLAHSPEEYMEVESFVPRAQAMARAIARLEQTGL